MYECCWLVCEGWLDVDDVVVIPGDVSARLSVAEGLAGASDEEWIDYRGMYERAARSLKLSQFTASQGKLLLTYPLSLLSL